MGTPPIGPNTPGFDTYVDWWDSNWKQMVDQMPMQNGMSIDIAFDNWGQPMDRGDEQRTADIFKEIERVAHAKGVQVNIKLSFGGATYGLPDLTKTSPAQLATQMASTLADFDMKFGIQFSGVDLDIEDTGANTSANVENFIVDLRQQLDGLGGPHRTISVTLPGQAWSGVANDLATSPAVQNAIDYYQFMEYDIWVPQGTSFAQQIQNDILTYIGPKGSPGPVDGSPCWGIPASKVRLGLMPGKDDQGHYLSPQDAQTLATFAKNQGLSGVMIWDAYRDGGDEGGTGSPPFTYTTDILAALGSQDNLPPPPFMGK